MKLNLFVLFVGPILALSIVATGCTKSAQEISTAETAAVDSDLNGDEPAATPMVPSAHSDFNAVSVSDPNDDSAEFQISQRLWQDFEYLFSTQATLTGFAPDQQSVKLLKSNGVSIEVEISVLCQEDQRYLDAIPEDQRSRLNAN